MKTTTVIADTSKGHRVFLEGVAALQMPTNTYTVVFTEQGTIQVHFHKEGKRTVSPSKGGVIDLQSRKVTQWAQGSTVATIKVHPTYIQIERV